MREDVALSSMENKFSAPLNILRSKFYSCFSSREKQELISLIPAWREDNELRHCLQCDTSARYETETLKTPKKLVILSNTLSLYGL